jgi:hypothetical protein
MDQRSSRDHNENAIAAALEDITRACDAISAQWALLGGQALIAYRCAVEIKRGR